MLVLKLNLLLFLGACAGCQTNGASTIKSESMAFERMIGPNTQEQPAKPAAICKVALEQLDRDQKEQLQLLTENIAAQELIESFPFVAFHPEKSYYVYAEGRKTLVANYGSTVRALETAPSLVQLIDEVCNSQQMEP